jgi:hypothetical protein
VLLVIALLVKAMLLKDTVLMTVPAFAKSVDVLSTSEVSEAVVNVVLETSVNDVTLDKGSVLDVSEVLLEPVVLVCVLVDVSCIDILVEEVNLVGFSVVLEIFVLKVPERAADNVSVEVITRVMLVSVVLVSVPVLVLCVLKVSMVVCVVVVALVRHH